MSLLRPLCLVALLLGALTVPVSRARAHEGPPFPVVVDDQLPPWEVSVWADPDVGLGTFWVQIQAAAHQALPDDTEVVVYVAPADGREAETRWTCDREPFRGGQQHIAKVEFPTREFWSVRAVLTSVSAGASEEVGFSVEVTPPGYGAMDLLLYAWPFLVIIVLWGRALRHHRPQGRRPSQPQGRPKTPSDAPPDEGVSPPPTAPAEPTSVPRGDTSS